MKRSTTPVADVAAVLAASRGGTCAAHAGGSARAQALALVADPACMEGGTGISTVGRSPAAIADLATVPEVGSAITDELCAARSSHTGTRGGVAYPTRVETGTIVTTVDSAPAPITHLAAIARPGHWIARGGRADIGIADAHAVFARPTRIDAGAVVAARERMTTAVGDVATVGASGGPDSIGTLIGGLAVHPADARVLGWVTRPSSGAVVATVDLAIAAVANQAAIRPP